MHPDAINSPLRPNATFNELRSLDLLQLPPEPLRDASPELSRTEADHFTSEDLLAMRAPSVEVLKELLKKMAKEPSKSAQLVQGGRRLSREAVLFLLTRAEACRAVKMVEKGMSSSKTLEGWTAHDRAAWEASLLGCEWKRQDGMLASEGVEIFGECERPVEERLR